MRERIPLGPLVPFHPEVLRNEETFLYRRMRDRDRAVLGVGVLSHLSEPVFTQDGRAEDWSFGHLEYGLKDEWHGLPSRHGASNALVRSGWFVPRWVVEWSAGEAWLHVQPGDALEAERFVERSRRGSTTLSGDRSLLWERCTPKVRYLENAARLMEHIQRGDIYEANYCVRRVAQDRSFDPYPAFARLLRVTDAPFAGFYRNGRYFALCASPERFLAIDGRTVTGEPMKGTRPRSADPAEDVRLRDGLAQDPKERSENIMALDVMRNDFSRIAVDRSVHVDELCAVRTLPQVHQMVSTVSAMIREGATPFDVVRAAFPMASMTGAPKRRAMQLIDVVEDQERGLYSGALGFFAPDGTADLNVVIRTVLFDADTGRLSLSTGSALTSNCDPAQEWEECELKARSVINALGHAG